MSDDDQTRLRRILIQHDILISEYQKILSFSNEESFLISFKCKIHQTYNSIDNYTKIKTVKPVLRYFLKTHIRKNLVKLRELYLIELIRLNHNMDNILPETTKLREIVCDIEKYIDTLQNAEKLSNWIDSILGILSTISQKF